MTVPTSSRSGKKTSKLVMPASISLLTTVGGQFLIGVDHDFAGGHVDDVGSDEGAFEIVDRDFNLRDLVLDDFLHQAGGDFAALRDNGFAGLVVNGVGKLQADQAVVNLPLKFGVLDVDFGDAIERAKNLLVGFETECAQENRTVELALTVDANVAAGSCYRIRIQPSCRGKE